uniref:Uncharacterized protein n=1 Tax=Rhizophora mucronata TaxID=61149 RepID=A0A2P2P2S6_RHIMU
MEEHSREVCSRVAFLITIRMLSSWILCFLVVAGILCYGQINAQFSCIIRTAMALYI